MLFCFSSWNGLRHPPSPNESMALELQTWIPSRAGEAQRCGPRALPKASELSVSLLSASQPLLHSCWLPGNQLQRGRERGRDGDWNWLILDIHPEKTTVLKATDSPVFTAALLTIAGAGKQQPGCPLTEVCIQKTRCMYAVEHYSATEGNTSEPAAVSWMNPEPATQSEGSRRRKANAVCKGLHMASRKRWTYLQGRGGDTGAQYGLEDTAGEGGGWRETGASTDTGHRAVLSDDLEGWAGVGWGGEEGSRGRRGMHVYGWCVLLYDRDQPNLVKQVFSN